MGPKSPGPAEIIRACQRDNEFTKRLKQEIDEMILEVFGQRVWMRYQEYSKYGSSLVYYALTNWMGYQTLGEEYVGIVQVDNTGKSVPSTRAISLMIFSQTFATPFINYVLKMIESFKERRHESGPLPKYLTAILDAVLYVGHLYQHFFPLLSQLHLAIFYVNGRFYEFSKRLAGINYFLIRNYFGNNDAVSRKHLKYLMWLSIVNLAITASHDSFRYFSSQMKKKNDYQLAASLRQNQGNDEHSSSSVSDADPTKKCSLCLEVRRHSSVTPCGHLFCWECIMDWLRNEGACPICRESITPSRVVPLQNFA